MGLLYPSVSFLPASLFLQAGNFRSILEQKNELDKLATNLPAMARTPFLLISSYARTFA